nr:MAG TPA: hypothetical protein [Caudoviricetes sp.]
MVCKNFVSLNRSYWHSLWFRDISFWFSSKKHPSHSPFGSGLSSRSSSIDTCR